MAAIVLHIAAVPARAGQNLSAEGVCWPSPSAGPCESEPIDRAAQQDPQAKEKEKGAHNPLAPAEAQKDLIDIIRPPKN